MFGDASSARSASSTPEVLASCGPVDLGPRSPRASTGLCVGQCDEGRLDQGLRGQVRDDLPVPSEHEVGVEVTLPITE